MQKKGRNVGREKAKKKTGSSTKMLGEKPEPEPEPGADQKQKVRGSRGGISPQGKAAGRPGRRIGNLKQKRKQKRRLLAGGTAVFLLVVLGVFLAAGRKWGFALPWMFEEEEELGPDTVLKQYYAHLAKKEYENMYRMLDEESRTSISREEFVSRHEKIYGGIGAERIVCEVKDVIRMKSGAFAASVTYHVTMDTLAGEIDFQNRTFLKKLQEEAADSYAVSWDDSMIFPDLSAKDRVLTAKKQAKRGNIFDRDAKLLAGAGTASSVGLVPGKMDPRHKSRDIQKLADILGISAKSIRKKLKADWVREDLFVPVKTIEKLTDLEQITDTPDAKVQKKIKRNAALLAVPGVKINDIQVRQYPLGEAASHLVGYVQQATSEDLKEHAGEGYTENSLIGKSGIEALYEKELKGEDGCEILLVNAAGETKHRLAYKQPRDGKDIYLTIDSGLQEAIYQEFAQDAGCSVAMDPYTGEVLALVSTPSFNANDFVLGMSDVAWDDLNQNAKKPLYNRFRQNACPGSAFKPVIAAIGIQTGAIEPQKDYGNVGLKWQKDGSWGAYYVTTLHEYQPVTMENALVHSDNIYFARAALRIGRKNLQKGLKKLGFHKDLPFDFSLAQSQYSNSDRLESEIQLADSGYGQGQILVNPVHLAALYTGFLNQGDVIKPYLVRRADAKSGISARTGQDRTQAGGEIWLKSAYTPQAVQQVKRAMVQIIKSKDGTGHRAYRKDIQLAGKTGTAEIKQSADDQSGTELGWFVVFTAEEREENPLLLLSMVEDVRDRGGSGYVVKKDRKIWNYWIRGQS